MEPSALPWALKEHGAVRAANVLNSKRAIAIGLFVVREFVRLRDHLSSNKALARKLDELEGQIANKLAARGDARRADEDDVVGALDESGNFQASKVKVLARENQRN